jgi:hypothetical protein
VPVCFPHIHGLRISVCTADAHITDKVRLAMLSLALTEEHLDIKKAFELIKSGGPKAWGSFLNSTLSKRVSGLEYQTGGR